MTQTYDVPHPTPAPDETILQIEITRLRAEHEALKKRVRDMVAELFEHESSDGVYCTCTDTLLGNHGFPRRSYREIPQWLMPAEGQAPAPAEMICTCQVCMADVEDQADALRTELAALRAWRTKAVNMANRAARVMGWCSDFETFMGRVNLPGRHPTFMQTVPVGWVAKERNKEGVATRWAFEAPVIERTPDSTADLIRVRDELWREVEALKRWRDDTLQPEAYRWAAGSSQYIRLLKLCGLKIPDSWGSVSLIPGEFDERTQS
jgi:hypothetical protein